MGAPPGLVLGNDKPPCLPLHRRGDERRTRPCDGRRPDRKVPALFIPYSADVADDGTRCLIRVSGEIDFETGPQLRESIASAAGKRLPVEVDLSGVRVMDSFGLGCLIRASRDVRMLGSTLTVIKTSPVVEELFHVTGTAALFGV